VWELDWSKKECLADGDHPLKPIRIRGVKFKGGESADAAMNRTRNSKGYNALPRPTPRDTLSLALAEGTDRPNRKPPIIDEVQWNQPLTVRKVGASRATDSVDTKSFSPNRERKGEISWSAHRSAGNDVAQAGAKV
jgi:hypothetical protein